MSKFIDERLERAVEDAGATLDKRLEKLDQVSHDIKELERHLEGWGIRERLTAQPTFAEPSSERASGLEWLIA